MRGTATACEVVPVAGALGESDAVDLAARLKALADPARLRLLSTILHHPAGEACTCELAPAIGLSEPTVSHHLKRLEAAGLVDKRRRGMNVYYRAVPDSVRAITTALHVTCC